MTAVHSSHLVLGGARSGKSRYAVEQAAQSGRRVAFLATARAADGDMAARIARHRAERPPQWTTLEEPQDLVAAPNGNAGFSVRATGFAPFVYQWFYNGAPIAGAASSNLVLTNVQGRMEGVYSATVANSLGVAVSRNALLTVDDGLVATTFTPLLNVNDAAWRYVASGQNLGNAWRFPGVLFPVRRAEGG